MSLKEPIVEGAWYLTEVGDVHRVRPASAGYQYSPDGRVFYSGDEWCHRLTRRVYLVPTDPAEVVAELRVQARVLDWFTSEEIHEANGWSAASDLVAEKLGVK